MAARSITLPEEEELLPSSADGFVAQVNNGAWGQDWPGVSPENAGFDLRNGDFL